MACGWRAFVPKEYAPLVSSEPCMGAHYRPFPKLKAGVPRVTATASPSHRRDSGRAGNSRARVLPRF